MFPVLPVSAAASPLMAEGAAGPVSAPADGSAGLFLALLGSLLEGRAPEAPVGRATPGPVRRADQPVAAPEEEQQLILTPIPQAIAPAEPVRVFHLPVPAVVPSPQPVAVAPMLPEDAAPVPPQTAKAEAAPIAFEGTLEVAQPPEAPQAAEIQAHTPMPIVPLPAPREEPRRAPSPAPEWLSAPAPAESAAVPAETPQVTETHSAAPVADPPAETPLPARTLSLEVETPAAETVHVRLSERPETVAVTVRSNDAALNDALRHGLPELTMRLREQGVEARFTAPATAPSGQSLTGSGSDAASEHAARQRSHERWRELLDAGADRR